MDNSVRKKVYMKLYYSLLEWEWYKNGNTMRVFIHLLLTANRKDQKFSGNIIRRGEALASTEYISDSLGLSVQQVRTALEHLKSTNEITIRKVGQTSVIRVVNYDKYQSSTESSTTYQQHNNNESTNLQQRDNKVVTIKQQRHNNESTTLIDCNNEENEENDKMKECVKKTHTHGKFRNVILTDEEYSSFLKDYPDIASSVIDQLSAKILTGDKKYSTGHKGHLYIFAQNYKEKPKHNSVRPFDPSCREMSDINSRILEMSRNLDPTNTKRRA